MAQEKLIQQERVWNTSFQFDAGKRRSELCKAEDFKTDWFQRWCKEIGESHEVYHRKRWEFVYILQALWERGCIMDGKKGLAFAVGIEPLPSVFATYGCKILATDIFPEKGTELGWANDNQLCFGLDSLNERRLCNDDVFYKNVSYRPVDMNEIPEDIKGFDFNWSSCSFEHLGSIEKGISFLKNQLKTLKPGGWAVHTTEFNLSSNDVTLDNANTVIFRRRDIEQLVKELTKEGHFVEELDYSLGAMPQDFYVDVHPHNNDVHLRLQLDDFVVTSIGLIIHKKEKTGLVSTAKRKLSGFFNQNK